MTKTLISEPWRGLPAEVADLIEPELEAITSEILEGIGHEVPEYSRPLEGNFGRGVRTGVGEALSQFVALVRDPDAGRELGREVYVALGRGELRQGRTLDSLQAAYRVGARVAWRRISRAGRRAKLDSEVISLLAEAIFAYIDELSADSVEGYAAARAEIEDERSRRRHELVTLLLREEVVEPAEISAVAQAIGWRVPRAAAAMACAEDDLSRLAHRLPADSLATQVDGLGCVLVSDPDGPGRSADLRRAVGSRLAALGPSTEPVRLRESWHLARVALRAAEAGAIPAGDLVLAEGHLGSILVYEGGAIATRIASRRLTQFELLTAKARERMEETALAYLSHRGNAVEMAAAMHLHPQTVRYRLARLRELLGDQLDEPDARFELELALRFRGNVRKTTSQSGEETPKP
jgi:PucR C-terminal helix-turn-helix domain